MPTEPTAESGTPFCHYLLQYHYILCHFSEFCSHNPPQYVSRDVYYCAFMTADSKKQFACIKFSFTIRRTASDMKEMLKNSFSNNDMGKEKTLLEWFSPLKHVKTLVEDRKCSVCPSSGHTQQNAEEVHNIMNKE